MEPRPIHWIPPHRADEPATDAPYARASGSARWGPTPTPEPTSAFVRPRAPGVVYRTGTRSVPSSPPGSRGRTQPGPPRSPPPGAEVVAGRKVGRYAPPHLTGPIPERAPNQPTVQPQDPVQGSPALVLTPVHPRGQAPHGCRQASRAQTAVVTVNQVRKLGAQEPLRPAGMLVGQEGRYSTAPAAPGSPPE